MKIVPSKVYSTFYYYDPNNKKIPATMGNFRCFKDHITFDKHPLQDNCNDPSKANKIYMVYANKCQKARSHMGPVYEKLVDYEYPGKESCEITSD